MTEQKNPSPYSRSYYSNHYLSRENELRAVARVEAENIRRLYAAIQSGSAHDAASAQLQCLDLGCGPGFLLSAFIDLGCSVRGFDGSQAAIDLALELDNRLQSRVNRFHFEEGEELPLISPETYDIVTIWDVLSYVEDPTVLLRYARAALKNGGILAVKTPNNPPLLQRHVRHFPSRLRDLILYREAQRYDKMLLSEIFGAEGFEIVQCEYRREVRPPLRWSPNLPRNLAVRGADMMKRLYGPPSLVVYGKRV